MTTGGRRCAELYESLHEARLWMSAGNTTSSIHFDTHENYMLQLDGSKDVYMYCSSPTAAFHPSSLSDHLFSHLGAECACPSCLIRWHPNESHKLYLDFHNKFGLSPLNADRVDLERYPEFAATAPMHMKVHAGDAFYIPEGHWHLIISHGPRNVAVALEFAPFAYGEQQHWPAPVTERYHWPGLFWAESVLIRYAMRERYGAEHYHAAKRGRPITCEELVPTVPLSELGWLGTQEHDFPVSFTPRV